MIAKPSFAIEPKRGPIVERFVNEFDMDGAYLLDGWDDMVAGIHINLDGDHIFVYDAPAIVDHMVDKEGLNIDEAWDHFYFNIHGTNLGKTSPLFVFDRELGLFEQGK